LALYYLGKDKAEQQQVIDGTIAGGMCINDLAMHFACDDMPFGGVGASGMGHYHGREGFKTFSHAKAVFRQGPVNLPKLSGTLPPYGEKVDKLMSRMIRR
jgi:coniferyl-aldehyde dehydrogenase